MSNIPKLNGLLIGAAGKQGFEYFKALDSLVNWVHLIDSNLTNISPSMLAPTIEISKTLSLRLKGKVDFALVCVPHDQHLSLCRELLAMGIPVIKEKPLALREEELIEYDFLVRKYNTPIYTITQRSFSPTFQFAFENLHQIGRVYNFSYDYFLNLKKPTSGWRADFSRCGGGVLMDMGYHSLHAINTFFGADTDAKLTTNFCYDQTRNSNLEDSALISFRYKHLNIHGQLHLERHHWQKKELFEILGEDGAIEVSPEQCIVRDRAGQVIKCLSASEDKFDSIRRMFKELLGDISTRSFFPAHYERHSNTVRLVSSLYDSTENAFALPSTHIFNYAQGESHEPSRAL